MYFLCYKNINNISKNTLNVNHNKRIVYLTFDDGPTKIITPKLLDVLKQHDVKATFFVVGKEIEGTEDILLRMYKEGHGIGLHTYSHNYKKVYSSQDIFIDEMIKTKEKVKAITGYTSNIIRFPGGSAKQLNKGFLEKLHKNNLKVFDWNVNLCDGINANLPVNKLVNNAKRYKNNYSRLIVLMHCNSNNKNTVKALPEIIKYYKNLGYEFKAITNDTKEFYYRFKK
ncbi:polysaccharide deacetylase family protein [Clostridium tetanomorphum]|uniref:Polysaccharide deacetylase n=2 Tax=Clostridium tetanomorphum TaxID=1553 RepID=A0A923EAJ4_CLOTT|nr:polysaccharide deacetylase family protein [Clostridium tetanomorphum]MBC2399480.1 polysaccharide deacetylase [Clostridium tetanomorphum]SQB91920.1 xylanase/chitin deacetylase [Clostridium tetanomorphum]